MEQPDEATDETGVGGGFRTKVGNSDWRKVGQELARKEETRNELHSDRV